jgi:hypothetical protein
MAAALLVGLAPAWLGMGLAPALGMAPLVTRRRISGGLARQRGDEMRAGLRQRQPARRKSVAV